MPMENVKRFGAIKYSPIKGLAPSLPIKKIYLDSYSVNRSGGSINLIRTLDPNVMLALNDIFNNLVK